MAKSNGLITKSYLDKKLRDFVTKTYLDQRLNKFKNDLKSELYDIKDEIVGEIKSMREEFHIHQYSHARINDEIQDHEKRIDKLEASSTKS